MFAKRRHSMQMLKKYLTVAACSMVIGSASLAQVKVGVIQGLSGPPAIVDFGESYLQGIRQSKD